MEDASHRRGRGSDRPAVACVECHNRATHVYQLPDDAVDLLMKLGAFFRRPYPESVVAWLDRIDDGVDELVEVWARNIHPGMRVEWGAYASFLGHSESPGCLRRCHTRDLRDEFLGSVEN